MYIRALKRGLQIERRRSDTYRGPSLRGRLPEVGRARAVTSAVQDFRCLPPYGTQTSCFFAVIYFVHNDSYGALVTTKGSSKMHIFRN